MITIVVQNNVCLVHHIIRILHDKATGLDAVTLCIERFKRMIYV